MKIINIYCGCMISDQDTETLISCPPSSALIDKFNIKNCSDFYPFDGLVYYCDYSFNSKEGFLALPIETSDTYIK